MLADLMQLLIFTNKKSEKMSAYSIITVVVTNVSRVAWDVFLSFKISSFSVWVNFKGGLELYFALMSKMLGWFRNLTRALRYDYL